MTLKRYLILAGVLLTIAALWLFGGFSSLLILGWLAIAMLPAFLFFRLIVAAIRRLERR